MALYNFHRVLIAASILFDAGFSVWCWRMYERTEEAIYPVMLVGSSILVIAFAFYLVRFNRKVRELTERSA